MRAGAPGVSREGTLRVTTPAGPLTGEVLLGGAGAGIVAFAHGSGSSRHSPRNRAVARALGDVGLGTFLVDLLTEAEGARDELTAELRFDIALLGERMVAVVDALAAEPRTRTHPIGLFGASTGAAAALIAAAERPELVRAVVSRGGRPDLAERALALVRAPTLLIVGEADTGVLELNRDSLARLAAPTRRLAVIPGATHLFEEPGTLDEVAALAAAWFVRHLRAA